MTSWPFSASPQISKVSFAREQVAKGLTNHRTVVNYQRRLRACLPSALFFNRWSHSDAGLAVSVDYGNGDAGTPAAKGGGSFAIRITFASGQTMSTLL